MQHFCGHALKRHSVVKLTFNATCYMTILTQTSTMLVVTEEDVTVESIRHGRCDQLRRCIAANTLWRTTAGGYTYFQYKPSVLPVPAAGGKFANDFKTWKPFALNQADWDTLKHFKYRSLEEGEQTVHYARCVLDALHTIVTQHSWRMLRASANIL